ncbi:MAG TPA: LapA family protein [Burkholderiales bacterium]|nr:LapA family protein [Burkholderiales bacterium]
MRYLAWLVKLALFLVLVGFAVKNTQPVTVYFYLGRQWDAPLVFVLLVVFVAGVAAGLLAGLNYLIRQRREMLALRRQLRTAVGEGER